MNKNDLVAAVATAADISKGQSAKAIEGVFAAIGAALKRGDTVRLSGFGTFHVSKRDKSTGRNPRTGEPITIAAAKTPKFKAGKGLKDKVNG